MPGRSRSHMRMESDKMEDEDTDYVGEDELGDSSTHGGSWLELCCGPCVYLWGRMWAWCWGEEKRVSTTSVKKNQKKKEDIKYILQKPSDGEEEEGESEGDGPSSDGGCEGPRGDGDGERHGSFTSASLSMGSGQSNHHHSDGGPTNSGQRDLKDLLYEKIEQHRRASGWTMRKESTATTAPLLDLRSLDFWSGITSSRSSTSEPQPVQPKYLLSPGRRDTISSQGSGHSAEQFRPDLYNEGGVGSSGSDGGDKPCPSGPLGAVHLYMHYDVDGKTLTVKVIEARDLPKPIQLDPSRSDQAHSNPYIKICLLPNQKDARQTMLRKKTQNPQFDETFTFEISFRELQRRTLQVLVKDFDKYSRHRIVGQVLVSLDEDSVNVIKGTHVWRQLDAVQAMSQEDLGEILFSLCYLPAAGRLNVDILRAKQLVPTDLVGGAAPYVRVSVLINDRHVKTKKTSYKKNTLDPVFNESLSFNINSVQLGDCILVISVMDFNGGVVKDNFIGRVVLGKESSGPHEVNHWRNMVQSQRTAVAQWHSLKSRTECDQLSRASTAIS